MNADKAFTMQSVLQSQTSSVKKNHVTGISVCGLSVDPSVEGRTGWKLLCRVLTLLLFSVHSHPDGALHPNYPELKDRGHLLASLAGITVSVSVCVFAFIYFSLKGSSGYS